MFSNDTWMTQEIEYAHFSHVMFEHEDVRISLFQKYKYRDWKRIYQTGYKACFNSFNTISN